MLTTIVNDNNVRKEGNNNSNDNDSIRYIIFFCPKNKRMGWQVHSGRPGHLLSTCRAIYVQTKCTKQNYSGQFMNPTPVS